MFSLFPKKFIVPVSFLILVERILNKVVLPDPFSPTRATIVLGEIEILILDSPLSLFL